MGIIIGKSLYLELVDIIKLLASQWLRERINVTQLKRAITYSVQRYKPSSNERQIHKFSEKNLAMYLISNI